MNLTREEKRSARTLGSGRSGTVYLVTIQGEKRSVKVYPHLEPMEDERRILKHLGKLRGETVFTGLPTLITDYVEGVNLDNFPQEKLDPISITIIVKGILADLELIHSKKVFHRDVKLENVITNLDTFETHLIDFGHSRFFTDRFRPGGSFLYYPPEYFAKNYPILDFSKCDMFGLGIVIYELCRGKIMDHEPGPFSDEQLRLMADEGTLEEAEGVDLELIQDELLRKVAEGCLCPYPSHRLSAKEALEILNPIDEPDYSPNGGDGAFDSFCCKCCGSAGACEETCYFYSRYGDC